MSAYLKALGLHVYLATTKSSYISIGKYIEANAQILIALRQSLSKHYLSMISHCDSTFVMWNTLSSLKKQASNNVKREPIVDEPNEACYMVQGNYSLEVTSDSHLDDCASTSHDDNDDEMHTY